jgi:S-formylglutathione hydrolase FrmB
MWSEIRLAGHLCDVFEPAEPHPHGYVLIYLHGVHLTRLVDKPAFVAELQRHRLPLLAPHTQRSWWTDKVCAEFDPELTAERHLLDNVLPYIAQRWQARPPQIGLFGTSMGGQGALRMAYKYPDKFPVVAAISPAIDYHLRLDEGDETLPLMYTDKEAARQDTALLHIHPLNWPRHQFFCCDPADDRWHDSAERLRMKLWSLGVPHEIDLTTTGGGHGFEYYSLMAPKTFEFLVERLDRERRRIP